MRKQPYEQPQAETFELNLQGSVLNNISNEYNQGGGGVYTEDDTINNGEF